MNKKVFEGVIIKFFLDKYVDENFIKFIVEINKNFKIYKLVNFKVYLNLYVKIVVFDNKYVLILLLNLFYNGIINNIEIGSILYGEGVRELEILFEVMLERKFFKKFNW